ncbi:hypothetical protein ACEPPN_006560 [Leptodophora sp. 'Broadleaf-Isolate-01']
MILPAQHPLSLTSSSLYTTTTASPPPSHNPRLPIGSFFSLGDSYSAGIGATCSWITDSFDPSGSCLKCAGAYPYQIIEIANSSSPSSSSSPQPKSRSKSGYDEDRKTETEKEPAPHLYHLGCTGASIPDILVRGWDNRTSQLELMQTQRDSLRDGCDSCDEEGCEEEECEEKGEVPKWATVSIGGNDVGFGDIVAECVMWHSNTAACEDAMARAEERLGDPGLLEGLVRVYEAVIEVGVGDGEGEQEFTLIVPGYARFFNEQTEECDGKFFLRGRYLTREFRARLNAMIERLNLVIRIAVAVTQMELVLGNRRGSVWFEDWDGAFEGRRFCEVGEGRHWEKDAWFFTVLGEDDLGGGDEVEGGVDAPAGEEVVDFKKIGRECEIGVFGKGAWDERLLCNWARVLEEERAGIELGDGDGRMNGEGEGELEKLSKTVYPWYVKKAMHPKSIAHRKLGKIIYRKWMEGEYS